LFSMLEGSRDVEVRAGAVIENAEREEVQRVV
jgi:hypothetical protein